MTFNPRYFAPTDQVDAQAAKMAEVLQRVEALERNAAVVSPYAKPRRNLWVNGDMIDWPRGNTFAGITLGQYTASCWAITVNTLGTWKVENLNASPPAGTPFTQYLRATCTTADASPSANDFCVIYQYLEGVDCRGMMKGTTQARPVTLSFWARSNVTGTKIVELLDVTNTRQCSAAYTILVADTWEFKTVTFPPDTSGAITVSVNAGFGVEFFLGAGSTYTGGASLQTTWGNTSNKRAFGQTNIAAAVNNYLDIVGFQGELGPLATPFELLPLIETWRITKRYYERMGFVLLTAAVGRYQSGYWSTEKRVPPTLTLTPDSGTGGTVTAFFRGPTLGFYQETAHSVDTNARVDGSAEM